MQFTGFSSDSFEQLIRMVSLEVLGPGVTVFGNGPDGGREATFSGKVNFPFPPADIWDGYGVIQAKFKERVEDTATEQSWAESQLRKELERWRTSEKRTPKPTYYIFCTNVELTSASEGGRDRLNTLIKEYYAVLGFTGHAIWDATQLRAYVDSSESIRRRFSCFFTTGDLLAEYARRLPTMPEPESLLSAFICKDLVADEDARLSQAGDRSEDRIRLAEVFVDLPVSSTPINEPPDELYDNRSGSLRELLRAASNKLDPLALRERQQAVSDSGSTTGRLYGRYVFLGGPGSGKSTIGQFLAQIHRAALLERRPAHRLEPRVLSIIQDVKRRCDEERFRWPTTPRYPFRIELNSFAKSLQNESAQLRASTFSEYLRRCLSTDVSLSHGQLRDWLKTFPWLLILDGLDEVPSSSNRREVIKAIHDFLNEARDVEADLMIVASSRPDGYAGEFDGDEVAPRYLVPFSRVQALVCAKRYLIAKHRTKDDPRAIAAMSTLTEAVNKPLIARLMTTPLQVTFMVTVVAASGKPSDSRWQLFSDYYRTIYERELHKAVSPFDIVLNERRQDIDALHHRVGFILQCRGELTGGTTAALALEEFEQIVRSCLAENELPERQLEKEKDMIVGAANQRLVFISSRTPGRLSFDVRSLQEYMAAACLTNADSAEIIARFNAVAHSAYWRNTLLFAIGRFFVEPQMRSHRDKIRVFCEDLNRRDTDSAATKLGSRIALEILESGTIGDVPLVKRSLAASALQLLEVSAGADHELHQRLAGVFEPSFEPEFRSAIDLYLDLNDLTRALPGWLLALELEKRQLSWASTIVNSKWPNLPSRSTDLMEAWLITQCGDEVRASATELDTARIAKMLPALSIAEAARIFCSIDSLATRDTDSWLNLLHFWWDRDNSMSAEISLNGSASGITLSARATTFEIGKEQRNPVDELKRAVNALSAGEQWKPLQAICQFYERPCSDTLGLVLSSLDPVSRSDRLEWQKLVPWPIACYLANWSSTALSGAVIDTLSQRKVEIDNWINCSDFGNDSGITLDQLEECPYPDGPARIHGTILASASVSPVKRAAEVETEMIDWIRRSSNHVTRAKLADYLAFFVSCSEGWKTDPAAIEELIFPASDHWWDWHFPVEKSAIESAKSQWLAFLDRVGKLNSIRFSGFRNHSGTSPLGSVLDGLREDSRKWGLVRLAGYWAASGWPCTQRIDFGEIVRSEVESARALGASLLEIARADLDDVDAAKVATWLPKATREGADVAALQALLRAIEVHSANRTSIEVILKKTIELIPDTNRKLRGQAGIILHKFLQAKRSDLDPERLVKLELPRLS